AASSRRAKAAERARCHPAVPCAVPLDSRAAVGVSYLLGDSAPPATPDLHLQPGGVRATLRALRPARAARLPARALPTDAESRAPVPLRAAPVWRRNFFAVWPSLFLVSLGLMMVIPTLPIYVEEKCGITDPDAVRVWAGLIYAVGPFTAAFAGPLWGALGDRTGRKAMVVRSSLAIAVCMALLPLATSPEWMLAVRAVQGAFAGYVAPAIALVAADVPAERHGRTIGRLQVALATGTLAGPAVGQVVVEHFGRDAGFWGGGLFALVGALAVAVLAREDRSRLPAPTAPGVQAMVRDVLRAPLPL